MSSCLHSRCEHCPSIECRQRAVCNWKLSHECWREEMFSTPHLSRLSVGWLTQFASSQSVDMFKGHNFFGMNFFGMLQSKQSCRVKFISESSALKYRYLTFDHFLYRDEVCMCHSGKFSKWSSFRPCSQHVSRDNSWTRSTNTTDYLVVLPTRCIFHFAADFRTTCAPQMVLRKALVREDVELPTCHWP